jgi:hypothetical protein
MQVSGMPSTVVHLALAGLVAAGLLGTAFSRRSLAVVFAAVVFADLDAFLGMVVHGTHRAAFHTLLVPLVAAVLVLYDTRVREGSALVDRFGPTAPQVAWVTIAAYAVAAIGLDLFTDGANPFYPVHDQFYRVNGKAILTNHEGFVQTFVDIGGDTGGGGGAMGSTKDVHVNTGVDPTRGEDPEGVRRIFPIAQAGWQLLLILTSVVVLWGRARLDGE